MWFISKTIKPLKLKSTCFPKVLFLIPGETIGSLSLFMFNTKYKCSILNICFEKMSINLRDNYYLLIITIFHCH